MREKQIEPEYAPVRDLMEFVSEEVHQSIWERSERLEYFYITWEIDRNTVMLFKNTTPEQKEVARAHFVEFKKREIANFDLGQSKEQSI